jgi:hypothetical protein
MSFREGTRAYGTPVTRTISGSSAQSAALDGYDEVCLFNGDTSICYFAIGSSPTATTSSHPLAAGERLHVQITPGSKVAVIGTAGTLFIIPCIG